MNLKALVVALLLVIGGSVLFFSCGKKPKICKVPRILEVGVYNGVFAGNYCCADANPGLASNCASDDGKVVSRVLFGGATVEVKFPEADLEAALEESQ